MGQHNKHRVLHATVPVNTPNSGTRVGFYTHKQMNSFQRSADSSLSIQFDHDPCFLPSSEKTAVLGVRRNEWC